MDFRTVIPIQQELDITHCDKVMMFGSCFSTYMGEHLTNDLFFTSCNPLGILFNPISILQTINRLKEDLEVQLADLFETNGIWNSFDFHSQFAQLSAEQYLNHINPIIHQSHQFLKECDYLFITLGTAWYYRETATQKIVANCHKQPARRFTRERLSVEECANALLDIIHGVHSINNHVNIVFTVSPIRHWKEGAHGNQISKSTLLLAIEDVLTHEKGIHYFPSYELLMDELRDYRFYAEDMLHPSEQAQKFIWEKFCAFVFSKETQETIKEIEEIQAAIHHKSFNPESASYQQFKINTQKKIEAFQRKHPEITKFAFS